MDKLTNNIGCMSRSMIEDFAIMVLKECGYSYIMRWTTAGDIMIPPYIYIDERHIDEYPYVVKERILHEVAHIDTHEQDDRHGEIFHARLAELINQFMAFGNSLWPKVLSDEELLQANSSYEWTTEDNYQVVDEARNLGRWRAISQATVGNKYSTKKT